MNSSFLKKYQFPLIIVAALFIFRMLGNQDDEGNEEETNEGFVTDPATADPIVKPQPKEKNTYTWYYVGNTGGAIKKIQQRCNMLITMCKKAMEDDSFRNVESVTTQYRIQNIGGWEKLKVDGNFGNKTGAFVKFVTGKNNTSLAVMRDKYTAFHQLIY